MTHAVRTRPRRPPFRVGWVLVVTTVLLTAFPLTLTGRERPNTAEEHLKAIRELGAEDFAVREAASAYLRENLDDARSLLEERRRDPDPEIAARIADLLGRPDSPPPGQGRQEQGDFRNVIFDGDVGFVQGQGWHPDNMNMMGGQLDGMGFGGMGFPQNIDWEPDMQMHGMMQGRAPKTPAEVAAAFLGTNPDADAICKALTSGPAEKRLALGDAVCSPTTLILARLVRDNKLAMAERMLLLAARTESLPAIALLVQYGFGTGQDGALLKTYAALAERDPDSTSAPYALALLHLGLGDLAEARRAAAKTDRGRLKMELALRAEDWPAVMALHGTTNLSERDQLLLRGMCARWTGQEETIAQVAEDIRERGAAGKPGPAAAALLWLGRPDDAARLAPEIAGLLRPLPKGQAPPSRDGPGDISATTPTLDTAAEVDAQMRRRELTEAGRRVAPRLRLLEYQFERGMLTQLLDHAAVLMERPYPEQVRTQLLNSVFPNRGRLAMRWLRVWQTLEPGSPMRRRLQRTADLIGPDPDWDTVRKLAGDPLNSDLRPPGMMADSEWVALLAETCFCAGLDRDCLRLLGALPELPEYVSYQLVPENLPAEERRAWLLRIARRRALTEYDVAHSLIAHRQRFPDADEEQLKARAFLRALYLLSPMYAPLDSTLLAADCEALAVTLLDDLAERTAWSQGMAAQRVVSLAPVLQQLELRETSRPAGRPATNRASQFDLIISDTGLSQSRPETVLTGCLPRSLVHELLSKARAGAAAEALRDRVDLFARICPDVNLAITLCRGLDAAGHEPLADRVFGTIFEHERFANPEGMEWAICVNDLAWLCARTKRELDWALEAATRVAELYPNDGAYLDTLAEVYAAREDFAQALKRQRRAVRTEPYDGWIRAKARAYERGERVERQP